MTFASKDAGPHVRTARRNKGGTLEGIAEPRSTGTRDFRIDALRGIAIILVILHHLQPWRGFHSTYLWLFYTEATCLGVPLFYLVSLYLLAQRADRGVMYFVHRILRLALLYVLFAATQAIVYVLIHHARPHGLRNMFYNGGPGLPIVGQSVFFFLFDLIVLVAVMWVYLKLPGRARTVVGVAIVAGTAVLFEAISFGFVGPIDHVSPVNYIVYVPLAVWLAGGRAPVARLWPILTVAYVALVVQNVVLHSPFGLSRDIGSWALYARLSLPVGTLAIMTAALAMKPRYVPALGPASTRWACLRCTSGPGMSWQCYSAGCPCPTAPRSSLS
jgi:fucose 4-O-acetylase-like acetyltransferase